MEERTKLQLLKEEGAVKKNREKRIPPEGRLGEILEEDFLYKHEDI